MSESRRTASERVAACMLMPFPLCAEFGDRPRHPHAPGEILGHVPDIQFDGLVHEASAVIAQFVRRHFVIKRIPQRRTGLILTHQQVERFGTLFRVECFRHLVNDQHFYLHTVFIFPLLSGWLIPTRRTARRVEIEKCLLEWTSPAMPLDRKSTRLNSSHLVISYAVFCL